jgi:hypothetical protein
MLSLNLITKDQRTCQKCGEAKPLSDFPKTRKWHYKRCKNCLNAYNRAFRASREGRYAYPDKEREYRRQRRTHAMEFMRAQKEGRACKDCGGVFHHSAMDFDHLSDDKVDDVAKLAAARVSDETILAEIAKCDLVCANCHRIRTWKRSHGE